MRLLTYTNTGDFILTEPFSEDGSIPAYAILSHTWGKEDDEITFEELRAGRAKTKPAYRKLEFCRIQAANDGLKFFWVDTCCIDKSNQIELQHGINSMYRWYRDAAKCYVYLSDVSAHKDTSDCSSHHPWESTFRASRWFKRGWTLQELLAPSSVEFFSKDGVRLGDKSVLEEEIHNITGISINALRGTPLSGFTVKERFSWAKHRETKYKEDKAYSLQGIFNVCIPLLYGEGEDTAFVRLKEEIDKYEARKNTSSRQQEKDRSSLGKLLILLLAFRKNT
jgi:heterokaryon incompatibility protein (HET)